MIVEAALRHSGSGGDLGDSARAEAVAMNHIAASDKDTVTGGGAWHISNMTGRLNSVKRRRLGNVGRS
jgi:hypothetical protein